MDILEFPDPERLIRDYLDDAFTGAIAAREPGSIKTSAPQTVLAVSAEWLQVELDGTPGDDKVIDRPTVRVNYWTAPGRRDQVKAGASLARGLILAHPGDEDVYSVNPLIGRSAVIVDPDTKNLMCWFTVRVNLRATAVAV